jgi:glycosyltransferase involved in cell wall biosynthesis
VKLIIQIPCLNEAETLPATLEGIPTTIPGVSTIETLVIDDGSEDGTAEVAKSLGVDHVVQHKRTMGLARAFATGLENGLRLGADIIVNTDGDNQYPATAIPDLVAPIVEGDADIVVANRQIRDIPYFSPVKKFLQWAGSKLVRWVSGTEVPDAPSGFRAYTKDAALHLNILTQFSYTLETVIQAGKQGMRITSVPVQTNPPTRPSRLQRSAFHFIKAQTGTILRLYAFYEPLRTFSYLAAPFLIAGSILLIRFLIFFILGERGIGRYQQSLTIGIGLFLVGVIVGLFGIQADIASKHRRLTQEVLYRLKKMDLDKSSSASSELDELPTNTTGAGTDSDRSG